MINVESAFLRRRESRLGFCLFEHKEKAHYAAVQKRSLYGKVSVVNSTNTEKSFILFKLVEVNSEMVALWLTATNIRICLIFVVWLKNRLTDMPQVS